MVNLDLINHRLHKGMKRVGKP